MAGSLVTVKNTTFKNMEDIWFANEFVFRDDSSFDSGIRIVFDNCLFFNNSASSKTLLFLIFCRWNFHDKMECFLVSLSKFRVLTKLW